MSSSSDLFTGTWELDPSRCRYEEGAPPRAARYVIAREPFGYVFRATWQTEEGQEEEVAFCGVPDGTRRPLVPPGEVDALSLVRVDERRMDSTAYAKGEVVSHAARVLSEDGRMMTVVQTGGRPPGKKFRNVSVYRRRD
jgi:hypothetical protein